MANLVLISSRPDDIQYFSALSATIGMSLNRVDNWQKLADSHQFSANSLIFWDLVPHGGDPHRSDDEITAIQYVLSKFVLPSSIFAVTDKSLNHYPNLSMQASHVCRFLQNNMVRRYAGDNQELFSKISLAATEKSPLGLARYFPENTKSQKIHIKKSEQRSAAVDAVQNFLIKVKMDERIATKAARATDELLLNAIFDAPVDRMGNPLRQNLDKKSQFDLLGQGVMLEIASCNSYHGICVTDYYGSFKKDPIYRFWRSNYAEQDYNAKRSTTTPGLGIYGIIQAGLSVLVACKGRHQTDAMIFIPKSSSHRDFRKGFQFTSCFISY